MANVPEAKVDPKSKLDNTDNEPNPKLILATGAEATSDKLFALSNTVELSAGV